jgi:peptide/nickel transport system substrate-binding protein
MRAAAVVFVAGVLVLSGCTQKEASPPPRGIIVAISGEVNTFNPLFAESMFEGEINDLLYPALVGSTFDTAKGTIEYTPLLASSWEFRSNGLDILFHLRTDARWSDGSSCTARDVQFSYLLYGDPDVASVRQSAVENLRKTERKLDIKTSVEVLNDSTVVFHFAKAYPGQMFDAGLPIFPALLFANIPRKDIRTSPASTAPISSGPFRMVRWTPMQEVVLEPYSASVLPRGAKASQLIFRVIPDYRSRIEQLRAGEVDLVEGLRSEDADQLGIENSHVRVASLSGRNYDYLGWNNIDPASYSSSKGKVVKPHALWGSIKARRAMTCAINREEIVRAYIGRYGRVAVGAVAPMFRWAYNDSLSPLPFDPAQASALLAQEGWRDSDGDGVLDKGGKRFAFIMKLQAGNQLRSTIATVVQQQLKRVKVEMTIEQVEPGTFWDNLMQRKYDAWYAGFSVPLQMQLEDLWGADLAKYPFNLTGYQNARVDAILKEVKLLPRETDAAHLWKEFQSIIAEEQPCTFLYWSNSLVGIHERVKGYSPNTIGITHGAWNWYVDR